MTAGAPGDDEAIEGIVSRLSLGGLLDSHPYDLSGGEQTRLAIAKLLLLFPRVLLLDEPTAGLDPIAKGELRSILRELGAKGCAILIATHDLSFAAETSDRCALFWNGALTPAEPTRRFFSGNRLYITQAARLTRDLLPFSVTAEEAIAALRKRREEIL